MLGVRVSVLLVLLGAPVASVGLFLLRAPVAPPFLLLLRAPGPSLPVSPQLRFIRKSTRSRVRRQRPAPLLPLPPLAPLLCRLLLTVPATTGNFLAPTPSLGGTCPPLPHPALLLLTAILAGFRTLSSSPMLTRSRLEDGLPRPTDRVLRLSADSFPRSSTPPMSSSLLPLLLLALGAALLPPRPLLAPLVTFGPRFSFRSLRSLGSLVVIGVVPPAIGLPRGPVPRE